MPVFLWNHKLTYLPVPKAACSTLKKFFFNVEHGFDFKNHRANGQSRALHALYPSARFKNLDHDSIADHDRYAVVREPVSRIVSCYRSKVIGEQVLVLGRDQVEEAGLNASPDLDEFAEKLPEYMGANAVIRRHARPLAFFLGRDASFFTRIFDISQLDEFAEVVRQRTGSDATVGHANKSAGRADMPEITARIRERIEKIYAVDYQVFGKWFASA